MLPLYPERKQPAVLRGLTDATTELDQVGAWWDLNPDFNIGLVTGVAFDALDLDGKEAVRVVNTLAGGYKHPGPVQNTGRGYHLLFSASGSSNHTKLAKAPIDYRGTRGYIVAAPSIHPDGHRYQWVKDGDLPPIPRFLWSYLFPPRRVGREDRASRPAWVDVRLAEEKDIVSIFREMGLEAKAWGSKAYLHCPFHTGDNQASLVLYLKTNSFTCFGCGATGDPLNVREWIDYGTMPRKINGW